MTLEFSKLTDQVYKLGAMIDQLDFDLTDKLEIAKERFANANDLNAIHERIHLVRQSDISGYRGAAPLDRPHNIPINFIHPAPLVPERATIIAVDGSQIYPYEQSPIHFYLLNIGIFTYQHGVPHVPQPQTLPKLFYHKDHVHDGSGRVVGNRTVDARRTVLEMQILAQTAWTTHRQNRSPIVALYDNQLMFWANPDVIGGGQLMKDYHGALQHLSDVQANGVRVSLAGYVDNPVRSRVILRLLFLMSLQDEYEMKARERELAEGGDLEGLRDIHLFRSILKVGERSAVMVQNSPRNYAYKKLNPSHEIAFFYIKVGTETRSNVARVDVPMWVARDPLALDDLHATLVVQSTMQGNNPYPYALTRADELAYVSGKDKKKLDEMIHLEMRRKGIAPGMSNPKARGKTLARSDQQQYELRTDLSRTDL